MNKRGSFLITTLYITGFLIMILVAFAVVVNNNLALTRLSKDDKIALNAAISGVSFVNTVLSSDPWNADFGEFVWDSSLAKPVLKTNSKMWQKLSLYPDLFLDKTSKSGVYVLIGKKAEVSTSGIVSLLNDSQALTGIILNGVNDYNLIKSNPVKALNKLPFFVIRFSTKDVENGIISSYNNLNYTKDVQNGLKIIPANSIRLVVYGYYNGKLKLSETIFQRDTMVNSSVVANGNMDLGDNKIIFDSTDPNRNIFKVAGNLNGVDKNNVKFAYSLTNNKGVSGFGLIGGKIDNKDKILKLDGGTLYPNQNISNNLDELEQYVKEQMKNIKDNAIVFDGNITLSSFKGNANSLSFEVNGKEVSTKAADIDGDGNKEGVFTDSKGNILLYVKDYQIHLVKNIYIKGSINIGNDKNSPYVFCFDNGAGIVADGEVSIDLPLRGEGGVIAEGNINIKSSSVLTPGEYGKLVIGSLNGDITVKPDLYGFKISETDYESKKSGVESGTVTSSKLSPLPKPFVTIGVPKSIESMVVNSGEGCSD